MILKSVLLLSALAGVGAANAAGLAGNSIAVYGVSTVNQTATGSASYANAATIYDFSASGASASTMLATLAVPSSGAASLTNSGAASSEGALSMSGDGKNLMFGGYRLDAGPTAAAASTVSRVVGTLNVATGVMNTTTTTSADSGNNIRSVYSTDSSSFFAAGAGTPGGITNGTLGSANTATSLSASTNARVVGGFGGNVYFSSASGTTGIYQYTPGTTGNQTLLFATTGTSPYGFQFLSATSMLVADDSVTGGLRLYTSTGGTWSSTSTFLAVPTRSFALANGLVYFTSADGASLESATFDGSLFGTAGVIATAPTNTVFRGVSFVPQAVPEPSAFAALGLGALALLRRRRA